MCGRFTLTADTKQIQETIPGIVVPQDISPRWNVSPQQPIAVVPNDGKNTLDFFLWGLIPSWAKDPEIGNRMINARAETLTEKPAFRAAFRRRRCLVLADGFYEWRQVPGSKRKIPMYIKLASGKPFAFAGLWEVWHSPDGSVIPSATIITTHPNALMEPIHNRMPVILPQEAYDVWLTTGEQDPELLSSLLKPYPPEEMVAHPVSTLVNDPKNELPDCILPLAES